MDEVYRGHRIAVRLRDGHWSARVTEARGPVVPVTARCPELDGAVACMGQARLAVDRYITYLAGLPLPPDEL